MLKPRSNAAAIGITRIERIDELWRALDALGDRRSFYLLERFVAGDVFHVDSLVWERESIFHAAHQYGAPPFSVAHQGGIFTTRTVAKAASAWKPLMAINREVLSTLGLVRGVAHTEFIRSAEDGRWYFLETSARVGGAYIVDVVEAATGINLWREWAKIEIAGEDRPYHLPNVKDGYAGLALTLARQEQPDTSAYTDPEIVYRVKQEAPCGPDRRLPGSRSASTRCSTTTPGGSCRTSTPTRQRRSRRRRDGVSCVRCRRLRHPALLKALGYAALHRASHQAHS